MVFDVEIRYLLVLLYLYLYITIFNNKKHIHCTYHMKLRRVCAAIVAMEKQ
jgi:hypothetical protein